MPRTVTFADVASGCQYVASVAAVVGGQEGPSASAAAVLVGVPPCVEDLPLVVDGVDVDIAGRDVTVSWRLSPASAGVIRYEVEAVSEAGGPASTASVDAAARKWTGKLRRGGCRFRVRAVNAHGAGPLVAGPRALSGRPKSLPAVATPSTVAKSTDAGSRGAGSRVTSNSMVPAVSLADASAMPARHVVTRVLIRSMHSDTLRDYPVSPTRSSSNEFPEARQPLCAYLFSVAEDPTPSERRIVSFCRQRCIDLLNDAIVGTLAGWPTGPMGAQPRSGYVWM